MSESNGNGNKVFSDKYEGPAWERWYLFTYAKDTGGRTEYMIYPHVGEYYGRRKPKGNGNGTEPASAGVSAHAQVHAVGETHSAGGRGGEAQARVPEQSEGSIRDAEQDRPHARKPRHRQRHASGEEPVHSAEGSASPSEI